MLVYFKEKSDWFAASLYYQHSDDPLLHMRHSHVRGEQFKHSMDTWQIPSTMSRKLTWATINQTAESGKLYLGAQDCFSSSSPSSWSFVPIKKKSTKWADLGQPSCSKHSWRSKRNSKAGKTMVCGNQSILCLTPEQDKLKPDNCYVLLNCSHPKEKKNQAAYNLVGSMQSQVKGRSS